MPGFKVTVHEKPPDDTEVAMPLHETEATPESESATVPEIIALELVNELPSLGEATDIVGLLRSILKLTEAVAASPEISVTVPVIC